VYGAVAKGRASSPRSILADAEALTIVDLVRSLGEQLVALDPQTAGAADSIVTRLYDYWDKVLSSNCKANVVIAQVLSSDSVGRYVSAPSGLARSLEAFLDTIVVSTVRVKATDGAINLLSINLSVELKLQTNYTSPVAKTTIADTARTLLQEQLIGRNYGQSLRISDLYALVEAIEGVDWAHITTQVLDYAGQDVSSTKVNSFGDVPLQEYEVVTMGNIPVVTIL
jgi:hypothetical protein